MRESALFGTMFGLGAGAVLVGVTVSRLVVGQAPEKPAEEPPAPVVQMAPSAAVTPPPPAAIQSVPPPVVSPVAPRAEIALSGQHRPLPRKHRRPSTEDAAPPKPAPIVEAPPPKPAPIVEASPAKPAPVVEPAPPATGSIANREAPPAAPPPSVQADDPPIARDAPIARGAPVTIVRGGVAQPAARAPGPHIIQLDPQNR